MKIFILALGSRGDFEPFLALAQLMTSRGHTVTIGTSAFHFRQDPALAWVEIGSGAQSDLTDVLDVMVSEPDKTARGAAFSNHWLLPQLATAMGGIADLVDQHEYFISNIKMAPQDGKSIIPDCYVIYDPPGAIGMSRAWAEASVRDGNLELVALHRPLIDPEREWGDAFTFTGFWKKADKRFDRPAHLTEFLDAGTAPAVLAMGSMRMFDQQKLLRVFSRALELCNMRGVIVGGWSEIDMPVPMSRLAVVQEADYDWLFPQAACVIHHGGVGTMNAVLRSAVPSILLPQIACQEMWAEILCRENLCAGVLETATLDAGPLARALINALNNATLRRQLEIWRGRIDDDRGILYAAELIETHWQARR